MKRAPPEPTVPGSERARSDNPFDSTTISDKGDPTLLSVDQPAQARAAKLEPPPAPKDSTRKLAAAPKTTEEELVHELKRLNAQIAHITTGYRRFTLAFFSGVIRGLGAAMGATVVFALFIALFSRLDTTPIIGKWVKGIVTVVKTGTGSGMNFDPFADSPTPIVTATPAPEVSPAESPAMTTTTAGAAAK